jgi:hypothetical protein
MDQDPTESPESENSRTAYLGRNEAIERAIESSGDTFATDWNVEDLAIVFSRLRGIQCSEEQIEAFSKEFPNNSVDDLKKLIQSLQELVQTADNDRFGYNNFVGDLSDDIELAPDESTASKQLSNLATSVAVKKKVRGSAAERLKDVLKIFANDSRVQKKVRNSLLNVNLCFQFPASSDVFCPAVEMQDDVNYGNIYKFLADTALIKKPKSLRP